MHEKLGFAKLTHSTSPCEAELYNTRLVERGPTMADFHYADGSVVQVGDRVRLEDDQWHGVVQQCFYGPKLAPRTDGYNDLDFGEDDVVLVARRTGG